jgi:AcrR family transcriptional regulator
METAMRVKDEEKDQQIRDAAVRLINEMGFAGASMAKIAKAAGVSPATIYLYFKNKDDMVQTLYLDLKQRMLRAMLEGTDQEKTLKAKLRRAWRNYHALHASRPEVYRFCEQFFNSPHIRTLPPEQVARVYAPLAALFAAAEEQGLIRPQPFAVTFSYMFGPLGLLVKLDAAGGATRTPEELDALFDMAWRAVAA